MAARADDGRRWARALAATVVWLRWIVVAACAAAAAASLVYLPGLGATASDASGLVKSNSVAIAAQERSPRLFGTPLLTEVALVQRAPRGLSQAAVARIAERAQRITAGHALAGDGLLGAIPVVNVGGALSDRHERSTTAVTYLAFDPTLSFESQVGVAHELVRRAVSRPEDAAVGITGVVPARLEQSNAIRDALPAITVGTLLLILAVVGFWRRSLLAPLVSLAAAGTAYAVAIGVVGWFGQATDRIVPQEVEALILVLVLGIVTDYSVFLLAETGRRMREGDGRRDAVRGATTVTAPTILVAGLIVAGGTASLAAGTLGFFRALGPALAIAAGIGALVALTLVPALLAIFARGDRAPEDAPEAAEDQDPGLGRRLLRRRLAAIPLALVCVAALGYAATDLRTVRLGFSLTQGLPHDSEARRAAEAAGAGFSGGIISPTELQLVGAGVGRDQAALARFEDALRRQPGVSSVIGPAEEARAAAAPGVGDAIRRATGGDTAHPFTATSGDAVRLLVVVRDDPFSSGAIATLERMGQRLPALQRAAGVPDAQAAFAGQTALAAETVDQARTDMVRLAVIALAVNLVLLIVFLRALVAPVVLLAASVLALGAGLGVAALVSRLLGWG